MRLVARFLVVAAVGASASCGPPRIFPACVDAAPDGGPRIATGGDPVLLAAGDIADPEALEGAEATAKLLDGINGLVAALGDTVNASGSVDDFLDAYASTWGRHRWRTRPAVGNHEYLTPQAGPYFAYFCDAAGAPFQGYYSYELGAWHIVVLNSECVEATGDGPRCNAGSDQVAWLRADLTAHASACTLAYFHHPRFTSGFGGDQGGMRDVWQVLYDARVDLVLNGHSHDYERFAAQSPDGVRDDSRGIREIVVGTGGARFTSFGVPHANSEVRIENVHGVLVSTLRARDYAWRFVAVDGTTRDEGSAACH